ncbi:MAG TPA: hypothetical protein VGJ20_15760 [Xanthobacteraceae bacterium]|jgi:uncharacterized integral membrane protein
MRWFYPVIDILFTAAVALFAIENRELVAMSFRGLSVRTPLAILTAIVYVLGAVTGGSLFAVPQKLAQATRAVQPATP